MIGAEKYETAVSSVWLYELLTWNSRQNVNALKSNELFRFVLFCFCTTNRIGSRSIDFFFKLLFAVHMQYHSFTETILVWCE